MPDGEGGGDASPAAAALLQLLQQVGSGAVYEVAELAAAINAVLAAQDAVAAAVEARLAKKKYCWKNGAFSVGIMKASTQRFWAERGAKALQKDINGALRPPPRLNPLAIEARAASSDDDTGTATPNSPHESSSPPSDGSPSPGADEGPAHDARRLRVRMSGIFGPPPAREHTPPSPAAQQRSTLMAVQLTIPSCISTALQPERLNVINGRQPSGQTAPTNVLNLESKAFCFLSADDGTAGGRFRRKLFHFIDSVAFERAVLAVIVLNSVTLAMDIPATRGEEDLQDFLAATEITFQAVFTLEIIVKALALGFAFHTHAYMRSSWNVMDFCIVLAGFAAWLPNAGNVTVLRLVRVVRPLRMVNRVPQMRGIIDAIVYAVPGMRDVVVLLMFFIVIFAIVGVQLFQGLLHRRCYVDEAALLNYSDPPLVVTPPPCAGGMCLFDNPDDGMPCGTNVGGRRCRPDPTLPGLVPYCAVNAELAHVGVLNWDVFYSAALLSFKVISLDDWPEDLAMLQNAVGWYVWVYFLFVTLFGSFFAVQLFLAVLSLEYYRSKTAAEEEEEDIRQQEDDEKFSEIMNHIASHSSLANMTAGAAVEFDVGTPLAPLSNAPSSLSKSRSAFDGFRVASIRLVGERRVSHVSHTSSAALAEDAASVHSHSFAGSRVKSMRRLNSSALRSHAARPDPGSNLGASLAAPVLSSRRSIFALQQRRSSGIHHGADPPASSSPAALAAGDSDYGIDAASTYTASPAGKRSGSEGYGGEGGGGLDLPYPTVSSPPVGPGEDGESESAPSRDPSAMKLPGRLSLGAAGQNGGEAHSIGAHTPKSARDSLAPPVELTPPPSLFQRSRTAVKAMILHRYSQRFMLFVTSFNVLALAIDHHNSPPALDEFIQWSNFVCSLIFIVELLLKFYGLGVLDYFTEQYEDELQGKHLHSLVELKVVRRKLDAFNAFDFLLVVVSIPELAVAGVGGGGSNFSALRIFRLARVLKVVARLPTTRQLLITIIAASAAVTYLFIFMLLFIFIMAIMGLQLFEGKFPDGSRTNFNSLWEACVTVFIVITGESWATIMKEGIEGTHFVAVVYFLVVFFFGNYLLTNLFIAILIDEFMRAKDEDLADREEEDEHENATALAVLARQESSTSAVMPPAADTGSQDIDGMYARHNSLSFRGFPSPSGSMSPSRRGFKAPSPQASATDAAAAMPEGSPSASAAPPAIVIADAPPSTADAAPALAVDTGTDTAVSPRAVGLRGRCGMHPPSPARSVGGRSVRVSFVEEEREAHAPHGTEGGNAPGECDERQVLNRTTCWAEVATMLGYDQWQEAMALAPEERADAWEIHGEALFLKLERTHPFRLGLASVVMHPLFEAVVLCVILMNVVALGVDKPSLSSSSKEVLDALDIAFTVLFTLEFFMKATVMGFYEAKAPDGLPKAYLTHKTASVAEIMKALQERLLQGEGAQGSIGLADSLARSRSSVAPSSVGASLLPEDHGVKGYSSSMGIWNRIDLFVVVMAFVGMGRRELKLFRSLRTVRLVVHINGCRAVLKALVDAVAGLANVALVCSLLWMVFGILAVQLFKGTFYYCTDEAVDSRGECNGTYLINATTPFGFEEVEVDREWRQLRYHFDHLGAAMLTLFEVAVGEGWAAIMFSGIDTRGVDLNPRPNATPVHALFFCCFVVVGQFFAMNLFVGMLIDVFTRSQCADDGSVLMTPAQREWVRANKLVSHVKLEALELPPDSRSYVSEESIEIDGQAVSVHLWLLAGTAGFLRVGGRREAVTVQRVVGEHRIAGLRFVFQGRLTDAGDLVGFVQVRRTVTERADTPVPMTLRQIPHSPVAAALMRFRCACFAVVIKPWFDHLITGLILLNVVVMGLEHYGQSQGYTDFLYYANLIFVGCFASEALAKIAATGPRRYFGNDWNKFDFVLVVVSIVSLVVGGPGFSPLRIGRVMRLINRAPNLQKLFGTLIHALPSLGNVTVLLVITYFIFGVVGVDLFGSIALEDNPGLTAYTNFQSVPDALVTLYIVATTETWTDVMAGCMVNEGNSPCSESEGTCGSSVASIPYFVCFMIFGSFVLLNLFVTIVMDEFNNLSESDEPVWHEASPLWEGLLTKDALSTHERIMLLDSLRSIWVKHDPLATGYLRVTAFITLVKAWCAHDQLEIPRPQNNMSPVWMQRFLARLALPLNEDLMVSYRDVVRSLLRELFQITDDSARVCRRLAKTEYYETEKYFMAHHFFAVHKISAIWARRHAKEVFERARANTTPPRKASSKPADGYMAPLPADNHPAPPENDAPEDLGTQRDPGVPEATPSAPAAAAAAVPAANNESSCDTAPPQTASPESPPLDAPPARPSSNNDVPTEPPSLPASPSAGAAATRLSPVTLGECPSGMELTNAFSDLIVRD